MAYRLLPKWWHEGQKSMYNIKLMALSSKWTFLKTQIKRNLENIKLYKFPSVVLFKTLKTYQENCLDIYNFYQILEIFIGCILFNIGLAITYSVKWGYNPKALWALCNLWVLSWYSIIKGFITASLGLKPNESNNSISKGTNIY